MASLNKVILIGRLTRDPELRRTPSGQAVTEIGLATNRTYKDGNGNKQEESTFHDVTFWGKLAEIVADHLEKGRECYIEGRLQLDSWDDKQTGQKRYKTRIIGEQMQFIGGRGDAAPQTVESRVAATARIRADDDGGVAANVEIDLGDSEIPF